ncbi:MAG TPA: hydrolase [Anaeromyxobacteraceae bacterium]|nr:hydrolase [Anaeromyxobacteraceae bacterium]
MPAPRPKLYRDRSLVVVVDVQDRLTPAMPKEALERLVKYARALIHAGKTLGMPVLASEQYPKGLGRTLPQLAELLPSAPLEKLHFSCGADAAFQRALENTGRKQVVIAGMESHVCVFQTARDLVGMGYDVHVCADAVTSRTEEHRVRGLDLCRDAGAVVTTAETAIFDLLQQAATADFKAVAPWVK